jgi:WD40 repeat protein
MNIFKQPKHRICTGENKQQCQNYINKKELPIHRRHCQECDSATTEVAEWNILAIFVAALLLVGVLGIGYWLFSKRQQDSSEPPIQTPVVPEQAPPKQPPPQEKSEKLASIESFSTIKSLNATSDGQTLVGGSQDGDIYLWNVETGQVMTTLLGHQEAIEAIAVSADGQVLVSASEDGVIKVWDLATRKELYTLPQEVSSKTQPHRPITSLAVSADGKTLVTGGQEKQIKLWNLETKQIAKTFGVDAGVESLAISQDAQIIVSGNHAGNINIWEKLNNGKYERRLFESGDKWEVHSVAIDSNGEKIVSSSCQDKIRVWNSNTLKGESLKPESASNICLVSISNDGKTVAGLNANKTINLWNLETQEEIDSFPMPSTDNSNEAEIRTIAFSGDGRTIAASLGKTVEVWRLPSY